MDKAELFTDGEAYERMMGRWSRLVGETLTDGWLGVKELRMARCRLWQRCFHRRDYCSLRSCHGDRD